ncbi:MAG: hypothetical protein IJT95_07545 [Abditibacteriota bacterium]|nr:hypothetical protein [Abditibacteriota bacterium]
MKKLICILALLVLGISAYAITNYNITFSVDGKRYTQNVSAYSTMDAKKLIQNRYQGHKVNFISVKGVPQGTPVPPPSKTKVNKPVFLVNFSVDGKKYQQAVYANTNYDAKRQIQTMYAGKKVTIWSIKKQWK